MTHFKQHQLRTNIRASRSKRKLGSSPFYKKSTSDRLAQKHTGEAEQKQMRIYTSGGQCTFHHSKRSPDKNKISIEMHCLGIITLHTLEML
jgi:hypothetical protein